MRNLLVLTVFVFLALFFFSCSTASSDVPCDGVNVLCDLPLQCIEGKCVDPTADADKPGGTDVEPTGNTEADNPVVDSDKTPTEPADLSNDNDTYCKPNQDINCVEGDETKIVRCAADGSAEVTVDCPPSFFCKDTHCEYRLCNPGDKMCDPKADPAGIYECDETGQKHKDDPIEVCDTAKGDACYGGKCMTLCEKTKYEKSYLGCDYFTANLHNLAQTRTDPIYAIVVSNINDTMTAEVSITVSEDGVTETDAGKSHFCIDSKASCQTMTSSMKLSIPPKKVGIIMFPHDRMIMASGGATVNGTGNYFKAYHLVSSIPLTAYQFNPFDNSSDNPFEASGQSIDIANDYGGKMYTNDASLLIPTTSVYTDYVIASYNSMADGILSYGTIIGINDQETEITITPSEDVTGDIGSGVTSIKKGQTATVKLKKFQVIQLEPATAQVGNMYTDMSGTRISCKDEKAENCHPFVVFGGHTCVNIPTGVKYCDHLEHQMFPTQTWGKTFVLVKSKMRGNESDLVRLIAKEDDTQISYVPAAPGALPPYQSQPPFTVLQKNMWTEFYFQTPIIVQSSKPIMVAQYITGSDMISAACKNNHTADCVGDPALWLVPPIEQFRNSYIFLTPGSYKSNFATIVYIKTIKPVLNGAEIAVTGEVPTTDYVYSVVDLGNQFKSHTLECLGTCGLTVYGWEQDVSYAYTGGLDMKDISQN